MLWFKTGGDDPKKDDLRVIRRFAWIPTRVKGNWLWWKHYQVLQEYKTVTIVTPEIPSGQTALMWLDLDTYNIEEKVEIR